MRERESGERESDERERERGRLSWFYKIKREVLEHGRFFSLISDNGLTIFFVSLFFFRFLFYVGKRNSFKKQTVQILMQADKIKPVS